MFTYAINGVKMLPKKCAQLLFLTWLILTNRVEGQITVPDSSIIGDKIIATVPIPQGTSKQTILFSASSDLETEQVDNKLFIWGPVGKYNVNAIVIPLKSVTINNETFDVINGAIQRYDANFTIRPGGPIPPDPTPGPGPSPGPSPPFPADSLTVLILKEAKETGQLPVEQRAILSNTQILKWLADNSLFRVWDDDYTPQQLSNSPKVLRDAYSIVKQQAAGTLPWIAISDGKKGFSGPLPANIAEMLILLNKFKPGT